MPLRDHFHPPLSERYHWEGFHSAWVNSIVRSLNTTLLPNQYRAEPQVHLGAKIEADVATWENTSSNGNSREKENGAVVLTPLVPPHPAETVLVDLDAIDVYEVRILNDQEASRLVAVLELVSPANKDRPEHRAAFAAKCIAYFRQQVSVIVVDIVTERHANLHQELLELLTVEPVRSSNGDLYAVSYRSRKEKQTWRLDYWPSVLQVNSPLSVVPLWLSAALSLPLDLETTYEETIQVLRIR